MGINDADVDIYCRWTYVDGWDFHLSLLCTICSQQLHEGATNNFATTQDKTQQEKVVDCKLSNTRLLYAPVADESKSLIDSG